MEIQDRPDYHENFIPPDFLAQFPTPLEQVRQQLGNGNNGNNFVQEGVGQNEFGQQVVNNFVQPNPGFGNNNGNNFVQPNAGQNSGQGFRVANGGNLNNLIQGVQGNNGGQNFGVSGGNNFVQPNPGQFSGQGFRPEGANGVNQDNNLVQSLPVKTERQNFAVSGNSETPPRQNFGEPGNENNNFVPGENQVPGFQQNSGEPDIYDFSNFKGADLPTLPPLHIPPKTPVGSPPPQQSPLGDYFQFRRQQQPVGSNSGSNFTLPGILNGVVGFLNRLNVGLTNLNKNILANNQA
ncbi:hypothetical protein Fcan01_17375 [Folsomia candida]|uniref:Uncharacterized protein n=1 Tax=Folsomia candida TaxID=158441 RepID=A0A226DT10_FOLCA|nr:hypothetical protein Fcan01_17375 [Folsomia candida]